MKNSVNIGCSSFYNSLWKGIFYPTDVPGKLWFEYYCTKFDTFEMNSTFYKMPTVRSLKGWHDRAPEDFIFSVKAPKIITHNKKFIDCREELEEFYNVCQHGLGDKLGHILFQTPPSYDYSEERLEIILSSLDIEISNVIEFRHISWWRPDVYEALAASNIAFCSVSYPNLPSDIINTNGLVYVRFHGIPRLFYSQYTEEDIADIYRNILESGCENVMAYFNNTASEAGIINALEMQKLENAEP